MDPDLRPASAHTAIKPNRSRDVAYAGLLASITAIVVAGLLARLDSFPGLHGDEAWVGLRALEQQARGMFTLRGMNGYTGSLFPEIVSQVFSVVPASVGSLRLAGAILNGLALGLTALALWTRGAAALYFALAMGSSLLFLFYSRVAWEVNALQNLLLALVLLALPHLLDQSRSSHRWLFLLLLAFSLGCWSHAIFVAAALSFAAATLLVALKWPSESSARLLLIGQLNLLVQLVLCARHYVGDGAFVARALPAMLAGLALIALATHAYVRIEDRLLPHTMKALTNRRVARFANIVLVGFVVLALTASPIGDVSFFGTVSGVILLERVVSYLPDPIEMIALHLRMVLLLALFAAVALRSFRAKPSKAEQLLLPLFCLWTIAYFPALRLSIASVADRYYIIPQFLLFVSIALAVDGLRANWKMPAIALLLTGFVHAQVTTFREAFRGEDRPPFELFDYAGYTDTSRHFMRLDALKNELKSRATCRVKSSSFFIAQPMRFLMAVGQPCTGSSEVRVEYCAACLAPVRGFELQMRK
ncbi:hypothetical protein [Bradyrhizobium sp. LTSP857]|uniref:hypothetical protein n=1 Tax=Bradyrhizobium sp. LTSP857 TaxID=1619231 RepID=UPI0005D206F8|nr:hypothetical protein [Bradyrhizobium sp. LTSP857]KJC34544.1 hypothetical protein UP06_34090 [Bradyrhizobium sp. LTSP857]